jgi:hypothetical protein
MYTIHILKYHVVTSQEISLVWMPLWIEDDTENQRGD